MGETFADKLFFLGNSQQFGTKFCSSCSLEMVLKPGCCLSGHFFCIFSPKPKNIFICAQIQIKPELVVLWYFY